MESVTGSTPDRHHDRYADRHPDRHCRRCGRPVVASAEQFERLERMHFVCFHYAFEHHGDPDLACGAEACPSDGLAVGV